MGCALSTTIRDPDTCTTNLDVYDFVELHCELSPKAHVSYMELAGALHTFLKARGRHADINVVWPVPVMTALVQFYNLTVCGPEVQGPRSFAYQAVRGVRIKVYPDPMPELS